jgi:DNA repair photolyase
MELREPADFEERIFAKHFHPAQFRGELARIGLDEAIAIGTATDPYQPAERRYGLTRRVLEVLAGERGRRLWITTKSDLVGRDAELLARVGWRNTLFVNLTVTTMDARLARLMEPRAPRPDLRMAAAARLGKAGVRVGVTCSPVLPLLNDSYDSLLTVARAAAKAGAGYFGGGVLFLKPCASQVFFPFLKRHFPHLVAHYRRQYAGREYLGGLYPEAVEVRLERARREVGLARSADYYVPEEGGDPQFTLFS